jgi:S1-C subfamily serine protease
MNALDMLIILIMIAEGVRGAAVGIIRSICSLTGFWVGLVLGAAVSPWVIKPIEDPLVRLLIVLTIILSIATITGAAGRSIGIRLSTFSRRLRLDKLDALIGGLFSMSVTLLIVWLIASMVRGVPFRGLNQQIHGSKLVAAADHTFPPAPTVMARIGHAVSPYGFPDVFIGREPTPAGPVEPATDPQVKQALQAAGSSTVKVEGFGCGGVVFGSGFVAAPDLVMTNAHVVAGIRHPLVADINGQHAANVVYFDPSADIAVLRTDGLAGSPLPIRGQLIDRGAGAIVLGYPGGGNLTAVSAGVRRQVEALGRDIYGNRRTERSIYELQASVQEGNSGGPLVLPDGTVIGMVFARSETFENIGYALTSDHLINAMEQARTSSNVSTQSCTAG